MAEFPMPEAFEEADALSIASQRSYMMATRWQLFLLVIAGGAGAVNWVTDDLDIAALVAAGALTLAALLRLAVLRTKPHVRWYEARAAAESAKSLSWRYAMGGDPFPIGAARLESAFGVQLSDIFRDLKAVPRPKEAAIPPTTDMQELRELALEARKEIYRRDRIDDQVGWYERKADWNRRRSRAWGLLVLTLQIAGAAGAFAKGFRLIDLDLFGLSAAIAASAVAWVEARQHGTLASAYAVTADELRSVEQLITRQSDESAWAKFVGEAEGAISREHTMWRASSSQRGAVSLS